MTPPEQLRRQRLIIKDFFGGDLEYMDQAGALKEKLQCAWAVEWLHAQSTQNILGVRKEVWDELVKALEDLSSEAPLAILGFAATKVLEPLSSRSPSVTDNDLLKEIAKG